MDLTGTQIKNTYGNVITIGAAAGTPQTGTLQNGAGENITSATLTGGTVTTSNPLLDMTQTWNDAGVTFTSLKLNVTDTASGANSLLLDLQVGGSSVFNVRKDGALAFLASGSVQSFIGGRAGGAITFYSSANDSYFDAQSGGITLRSTSKIGWTNSATSAVLSPELELHSDAAYTLAQRVDTNAQTFNIYNTYTDGSNYERGFLKWGSNIFNIGTEELGTGSARAIKFQTSGSTRLEINTSGHTVVTTGRSLFLGNAVKWTQADNQMQLDGGSLEMLEQTAPSAPSANAVRIYAEDNGSGKTKLMALFATGVAQQIAIEP